MASLSQSPNDLRRSPRSKEATLSKYQEQSDDANSYASYFQIQDQELDLSYSKFSQVSGSIVRTSGSGSESPFVTKIKDSVDLEYDSSRPTSSKSHRTSTNLNFSPKFEPRSRPAPRSEDQKPKESTNVKLHKANIYSIAENQTNELNETENMQNQKLNSKSNYENESPFIEKSALHSPKKDQLNVHKVRSRSELPIQPNPSSYIMKPSRAVAPDSASTPQRNANRHTRNPSVKVSLTPAQRFEKRPGTRSFNALENFQFSTLIGRGAFANVFKGINLKTKQVVAIKQILLEKDQDVMELMGEIDLLKILKHPNIVKYHGFVKTSTSLNVFLEFCSGGSLRQVYKKRGCGFPESDIVEIVRSILMGLNYLHEQGVVHRDVKAANVLLTEKGDIKLADFGVATKVSNQHHTVVGTPNWMAPETVLGGEGLCTASDIWSLGATIIELFTTYPPYHDLNPMATLHAIGTDDHPPLPKNISSVAKDFLLECFQKLPNLRISAKLLLKHKWLTQPLPKRKQSMLNIQPSQELAHTGSIKSYSETNDDNENNWDHDFEDGELKIPSLAGKSSMGPVDLDIPNVLRIDDISQDFQTVRMDQPEPPKYSKNELLTRFSEENEDNFETNDISSFKIKATSNDAKFQQNSHERVEDDEDPFLNIDIEDFDTNELEIQTKMEYLMSKFSSRVDLLPKGNDELIKSLIKITGRMLHLVKKYQISHITLIKDHGMLSLLEVLDYTKRYPNHEKLWLHVLSILNHLFEINITTFENFCLIGGIPLITQFKSHFYDLSLRLQVIKFIGHFKNSEKALTTLISCGGLRVVTKFVQEDFDTLPMFPLISIECIHNILTKDLIRSKSDLCRILSKYGVIFWFVVLLNKLVKKEKSDQNHESIIDMIIDIIKCFGQSEPRVRLNIASADLFKLLIGAYDYLSFANQLTILKFFKSMSCLSGVLKSLYTAEALPFIATLMKKVTHNKEIMNLLCPILYNCCYLNHKREIEIINLGLVPLLKELSLTELPFKQFVLPVFCELAYCGDNRVRKTLADYDVLDVYFKLLLDPYWQSNSLDSIIHWYQNDNETVKPKLWNHMNYLIKGFMLSKVSNLESTLENFLKLMTINEKVAQSMGKPQVLRSILDKLETHNKSPVVQLTLLRILKCLLINDQTFDALHSANIYHDIKNLGKLRNKSVLVDELVIEIMEVMQNK